MYGFFRFTCVGYSVNNKESDDPFQINLNSRLLNIFVAVNPTKLLLPTGIIAFSCLRFMYHIFVWFVQLNMD